MTARFPHSCRRGCRWGGALTAHCSSCHQSFTTVRNFDKHQSKDQCQTPEQVGLVVVRDPGVYGQAVELDRQPPGVGRAATAVEISGPKRAGGRSGARHEKAAV